MLRGHAITVARSRGCVEGLTCMGCDVPVDYSLIRYLFKVLFETEQIRNTRIEEHDIGLRSANTNYIKVSTVLPIRP